MGTTYGRHSILDFVRRSYDVKVEVYHQVRSDMHGGVSGGKSGFLVSGGAFSVVIHILWAGTRRATLAVLGRIHGRTDSCRGHCAQKGKKGQDIGRMKLHDV